MLFSSADSTVDQFELPVSGGSKHGVMGHSYDCESILREFSQEFDDSLPRMSV